MLFEISDFETKLEINNSLHKSKINKSKNKNSKKVDVQYTKHFSI